MKWNVLIPLSEKVLDIYPDLAAIFEDMRDEFALVTSMNVDQIVRYIVLVYHRNSPLIEREENIIWRKKRAMLLVGMPTTPTGYFSDGVNAIIANMNNAVIDLKMRFFRFEHNIAWMQLCNYTELFFENQKLIGQAISEGKKSADEIMKIRLSAQKDSEMLEQKLKSLSDEVFIGDIDLLNFVGSTIVKDAARLRLSMESRARS